MALEHGACGKEGVAACATPYSESAAAWILGLGNTAGFAALAGTSAAEHAAVHPQQGAQLRDSRGGAATDTDLWAGSDRRLELQRRGSGTASKPTSGGSSSMGGSLKPPLKQRAQRAWRNRAKVQKPDIMLVSDMHIWHVGHNVHPAAAIMLLVLRQMAALLIGNVAAALQEKLQHAAAQLDTLQQEVQQLSVARVRSC